eukprot:scaffold116164_cov71-Attheya_sp.AAC.2
MSVVLHQKKYLHTCCKSLYRLQDSSGYCLMSRIKYAGSLFKEVLSRNVNDRIWTDSCPTEIYKKYCWKAPSLNLMLVLTTSWPLGLTWLDIKIGGSAIKEQSSIISKHSMDQPPKPARIHRMIFKHPLMKERRININIVKWPQLLLLSLQFMWVYPTERNLAAKFQMSEKTVRKWTGMLIMKIHLLLLQEKVSDVASLATDIQS